ncbi:MAG: response regulator [Aquabacterium sp.]
MQTTPIQAGTRKRVLVIDDSPISRTVTQIMLEQAGYDVMLAVDGQQAQSLASEVDAVVCDLHMPVMDGFGFVAWLRRQSFGQRLPVVIASVDSNTARKQAGRDLGAAAWITKPFMPGDLVSTLRQLGL